MALVQKRGERRDRNGAGHGGYRDNIRPENGSRAGEGLYSETVACSGIYSDLKEGKAALRKGKKIKEARIKLAIESDECEFTFKADSFQIQTMKLPPSLNMAEEEAEKEGRILERIYLTETAFGMMEKLFTLFLGKRLSPEWDAEEVPRIKKWMRE